MFERWAGRKMALHQLIRGYKSGSDLSWMWNNSGHLFFFPFFFVLLVLLACFVLVCTLKRVTSY